MWYKRGRAAQLLPDHYSRRCLAHRTACQRIQTLPAATANYIRTERSAATSEALRFHVRLARDHRADRPGPAGPPQPGAHQQDQGGPTVRKKGQPVGAGPSQPKGRQLAGLRDRRVRRRPGPDCQVLGRDPGRRGRMAGTGRPHPETARTSFPPAHSCNRKRPGPFRVGQYALGAIPADTPLP